MLKLILEDVDFRDYTRAVMPYKMKNFHCAVRSCSKCESRKHCNYFSNLYNKWENYVHCRRL